MLSGFLLAGLSADAQTGDSLKASKGKITVNIMKEVNGKTTRIDTTFDLKDEQEISGFMQRHEIEMKQEHPEGRDVRVMRFKTDGKEGDDKEITITIPPTPPGEPVPPPPPMMQNFSFSDGISQSYSISISEDELADRLEELEKLLESTYSQDGRMKKEIRKIEIRDDDKGKHRKSKKTKKRIIIIEEV